MIRAVPARWARREFRDKKGARREGRGVEDVARTFEKNVGIFIHS
jgi:hypothetical protein